MAVYKLGSKLQRVKLSFGTFGILLDLHDQTIDFYITQSYTLGRNSTRGAKKVMYLLVRNGKCQFLQQALETEGRNNIKKCLGLLWKALLLRYDLSNKMSKFEKEAFPQLLFPG